MLTCDQGANLLWRGRLPQQDETFCALLVRYLSSGPAHSRQMSRALIGYHDDGNLKPTRFESYAEFQKRTASR